MTTTFVALANFICGEATKESEKHSPVMQNKKDRYKTCRKKQKVSGAERRYIFLRKWASAGLMLASRQRPLPRLRTSFAAKPRREVRNALPRQTKRTGIKPVLFVWRGREDSNFRTGNPAYILSRDASYSLLSTPTRTPFLNGCKPLFTQFALQLYTIFFHLSIVFYFYFGF